jgi:mannosyl-3-phosphoglycerate phosphatase
MFQIFITDLDGTLLDHHTYDYSPAWPALHRLKKEYAPLILSTSKTAAEIIPFRLEIDNHDPFIVENGGGIFIPEGYFSSIELETREVGRFLVISHAPGYTQLQESLAQLAERHNVKVESFAEMTPSRLAAITGLSEDQAQLSLKREFDLPFQILDESFNPSQLEEEAHKLGLRLTQGGRFLHLGGDTNKGQAVTQLLELYQLNHREAVRTIGLGDSENDLSMLEAVHIAVVIPNPHSQSPLTTQLPSARIAQAPGPEGWNQVVLSLLD